MKSKFNKTQLNVIDNEVIIHRDYLAHCLRWTYVYKCLLKMKGGVRILDVGCGDFPLLETLYRNKYSSFIKYYLGVDVRDLTEKFSLMKAKCEKDFVQHDCSESMPFDDIWDIIVSFEILEHMSRDNGVRLLYNIVGCMNKGTVLFLSTPNFDEKNQAKNHIYEWKYDELKDELEKYFIIEKHYGTFASMSAIKPVLTSDEVSVFEKLNEYYDSNMLSVLMAPLHPEQSRNCLWRCRKK